MQEKISDIVTFTRKYATELWSDKALRSVPRKPKTVRRGTIKQIIEYFPPGAPVILSATSWTKSLAGIYSARQTAKHKVYMILWVIRNKKGELPACKEGRKELKPPKLYFRGLRKKDKERFEAYISNDLDTLNTTIAKYLAGIYNSMTGKQVLVEAFKKALEQIDMGKGVVKF